MSRGFLRKGQARHRTRACFGRGRDRARLLLLRPPLVYGPGVGGNFRALLRLARSGLPLPFAGLDNHRSLIARDNLIDLIAACCAHPSIAPAGRGTILLVRDGTDLSTPELIRILAASQGRKAILFALPKPVFAGLRRLPLLGAAFRRLTLSLQIDDGPTRAALGWRPRWGPRRHWPKPPALSRRSESRRDRSAGPARSSCFRISRDRRGLSAPAGLASVAACGRVSGQTSCST